MTRIPSFVSDLFPKHLSQELKELYLTLSISNLATNAVLVFEPIFLFRLGYSVPEIILFYLAVYVLYFILMPLGGKAVLASGYGQSMFASSIFQVAYYLALFGIQSSPFFIPLAVFCYAAQKTLYFPSYHYELANYGLDEEEGREVSNFEVLDTTLTAIGPFLGGLILLLSNFSTLFVVASILILLSNFMMLLSSEEPEAQEFSYRECYERLLDPEKRSLIASFMGYGEEYVLAIMWPFFIYLTYVSNLFSLGTIIALTTMVSVFVILYVGRLTDRTNKHAVLKVSTLFYTCIWWLRLFVQSLGGVIVVDTLSRLTKRLITVPQMSLVYERARQRRHAVATVILFEMSLVLGKISAMILCFAFFVFAPDTAWQMTFLLAGLFSLLYLFL